MKTLTSLLAMLTIFYVTLRPAFAAPVETAPAREIPFTAEARKANLALEAFPNEQIRDTNLQISLHNLRFTKQEYKGVKRELARKVRERQSEPLTLQQLLMWAEMMRKEMRECATLWTFNHFPTIDDVNTKIESQCL